MSTSLPSDHGNRPGVVAGDLVPDPLLASGSFISSTTSTTKNAGNETLDNGTKGRTIQGGNGVFVSGESVMDNGTDQVHPVPDKLATPVESKSRKRAAPGDNWLPPGWRVEDRVRTSGATAGSVDKYYHEPITGRRFRSKTEVLYYLEHGTSKRGSKKAENTDFQSDHWEGQGSNKANRKAKEPPRRPLNFDFHNPPEKVSWVVTNATEETWAPFIGDDKVQDSMILDWGTAFTAVTSQNASKMSF